MEVLCGIDIGGTKIETALFELSSPPRTISRIRHATEAGKGYEQVLCNIEKAFHLACKESGYCPLQIGICSPGCIDTTTGLLINSPNTQCMNGKPFPEDLQQRLGIPVSLANDAQCFALAEALLGVGKGASSCFGVILGTGVGGGLILNREVHNGYQGIAGHWGHMCVDIDGEPCPCGRSGCLETFCSGPALERYYAKSSGTERSLSDIVGRRSTDPHAEQTLRRLVRHLASALGSIINIFDPEVVVLGGGVSNTPGLVNELHKALAPEVLYSPMRTKVALNLLGDSAGVFGAGLLSLPKDTWLETQKTLLAANSSSIGRHP